MKILLVNDSYKFLGGAETYLHNLCGLLKKNNHQVFVLSFGDHKIQDKNNFVIKSSSTYLGKYFSSVFINMRIFWQARKIIKKINPDIVHLQNVHANYHTILAAANNFKVIQTVHDIGLVCPTGLGVFRDSLKVCELGISDKCWQRKCIKRRSYLIDYKFNPLRRFIRNIKIFIAPSKFLKSHLEKHYENKTVYLPCFINSMFNTESALEPEKNILFVGRLSWEKGVKYLIEAFGLIQAKHKSKAKLFIVGEGPDKTNLEKKVLQEKIKNVEFLGRLNKQSLAKYYSQTSVVTIPSVSIENSPLVVYEAMSFAKPVVGFESGGISELIQNGSNGFIVESKNTKDLAEKINLLLDNIELSKSMGKKGLEKTKSFRESEHYEALMEIYQQAVVPQNSVTIRQYQAGDEEQLLSVYNKIFKKKMTLDFWQWKYRNNSGGFKILVGINNFGAVVGQYALQRKKGLYDGEENIFWASADVCLEKKYRGNNFIKKCSNPHPLSGCFFSYGFPELPTIKNYKKAGLMDRKIEINIFSKKIPIHKKLTKNNNQKVENYQVIPLNSFNEKEINIFWEEKKSEIPFGLVRNWEYLKWRILDCPKDYKFFAIKLGEKNIGWFVLKIKNKICYIGEICVLNNFLSNSIVRLIQDVCFSYGASEIKIITTDKKLIESILKDNFKAKESMMMIFEDKIGDCNLVSPYISFLDTDFF